MKVVTCIVTVAILFHIGTANAQTELWGVDGSTWTSKSILPDFSFSGYRHGERSLPVKESTVSIQDFGAIGDGKTDCTDAFKRALAASAGKVIHIPKGVYVISDRLSISSANTVLIGDGPNETILHFTKGLQEIEPTKAFTGGGFETNNWSWSGGIITLGKSSGSGNSLHAPITSSPQRGATTFQVEDPNGMEVGQECLVQATDPQDNSLVKYLYRDRPGDVSLIKDKGISISQAVTIASIDGNTVTTLQALRFDLRLEWKPVIFPFINDSQEIGIAGFTIRFPERPYRGHWMEDGMNGFEIRGVNNWARNIRIQNCDSGVFVTGTWCTVDGLVIESEREAHESGNTGHHGITMVGRECLMNNFRISTKFFHDVTVSGGSVGNVFSKGEAVDMSIDHHRDAPYENLFTQIDAGVGTHVFTSGGTKGKGLHTASGATFWNIDSKDKFQLPSEEFGPPGLVFVGLNLKTVRKADLVEGWHYERSRPSAVNPQNLYLAQLAKRQSAGNSQAPTSNEFHRWTNQKGTVIEAVFLGLSASGVKLKLKDGREFVYSLEQLAPESRELARRLSQ